MSTNTTHNNVSPTPTLHDDKQALELPKPDQPSVNGALAANATEGIKPVPGAETLVTGKKFAAIFSSMLLSILLIALDQSAFSLSLPPPLARSVANEVETTSPPLADFLLP